MTPHDLIASFGTLVDAPDGVKRLRELVLQLAVRGKLVPQEAGDEPAGKLFASIVSTRKKLVATGQMRAGKSIESVTKEEIPFVIPDTWLWCRLAAIGDWGAGATPRRGQANYFGGPHAWLKSGELTDGLVVGPSEETVTDLALKECSLRQNLPGDVLIAMYGATIGKLGLLTIPATTNQAVCGCTCVEGVFNRYLFTFLFAWRRQLVGQGAGGAQPNISKEKIVATVMPLPPLAEQHRIVAKVDEVMAFLDKLEAAKNARDATRTALRDAALAALRDVESPDDVEAAWGRIAGHMDDLFAEPADVGPLRQAVLQLAVRGRLVRQEVGDEPVAALLKGMRQHRQRVESDPDFRARSVKDRSTIVEFGEVPRHWAVVPMHETCRFIDYRGLTPPKVESGVRLVTAKNVKPGRLSREPMEFVSRATYEHWMTRGFPAVGDLLFTTEAPLGHIAQLDEAGVALAQRIIAFQPFGEMVSRYMMFAVMSPQFQNLLREESTGMTASGIKAERLKKIGLPVPPAREQHRIVAKVDELMALLDKLEARLRNTKDLQGAFAAAAVHRLDVEVAAPGDGAGQTALHSDSARAGSWA